MGRDSTSQHDATLLDVLIDGFEKNEILFGFHWRNLPMPDEAAAIAKFTQLAAEATRWKGEPDRRNTDGPQRIVAWHDLEVRQVGRGIMVRVRAPWFDGWWHESATWEGDPMGPLYAWLHADRPQQRNDAAN